jgi:hypothetical protein
MKGWLCGLLVVVGAPTAALAQEETKKTEMTMGGSEVRDQGLTGPEIGLRVGFQAATGHAVENAPTLTGEVRDISPSDVSNGGLPNLQLDLGMRVSPHLFLGVYGSWTNSLEKENPWTCPAGFECSTNQYRAGIQAQFHFMPGARFDPWLGLGTGIIVTNSDNQGVTTIPTPAGAAQATVNPRVTDRGPEFANLSFGLNLQLGGLSIGPVIQASAARNTVRVGEQDITLGGQTQTLPLGRVEDGTFFNFMGSIRLGYTL